MTAVFVGGLSIGGAIPMLALTNVNLSASVAVSLPDLNARLVGLLNVSAALTISPPDLTATINAAIATVVSLQAAISGPTVTLQISAIASVTAQLQLEVGALEAFVDFSVNLDGLLSSSVAAYTYSGIVSQAGPEIEAVLAANPPGAASNQSFGVLLIGTTPAAIAALGEIFAT